MTKIYGLAFHSPLIIFTLVNPKSFSPVLLIRENPPEMRKALEDAIKTAKKRPLVVLCGSLSILHFFLKEYGNTDHPMKVLLFDFPGLLIPFNVPQIEWLDCDQQSGGAWQITKLKPEMFEEHLSLLDPIDGETVTALQRISRYAPKERISEMERLSRNLPETYKELLQAAEEARKNAKALDREFSLKNTKWKKQTYKHLIKDFLICLPKPKRAKALETILDYMLAGLNKREYGQIMDTLIEKNNDSLKKMTVLLRKWMDDQDFGMTLYNAYLDYVENMERRSWKTILKGQDEPVDEGDLLLLVAYQSRSKELREEYEDDLGEAKKYPADTNAPKQPYHPEPMTLESTFDLEGLSYPAMREKKKEE